MKTTPVRKIPSMRKPATKAAMAALLTGLSCLSPASAQTSAAPDVMVVFDASGSMWGQIDGFSKIEIARDAFVGLSSTWGSKNVRAGLMAYGHRRKGDCSDIELISRPSVEAAASMAAQINKLTPKGKTPLSAAVRQAADVMKFQENAATVILVSDGIETCNLDPCAVGKELETLGIDFTAHVIGFGIEKKADKAQLACLAEKHRRPIFRRQRLQRIERSDHGSGRSDRRCEAHAAGRRGRNAKRHHPRHPPTRKQLSQGGEGLSGG